MALAPVHSAVSKAPAEIVYKTVVWKGRPVWGGKKNPPSSMEKLAKTEFNQVPVSFVTGQQPSSVIYCLVFYTTALLSSSV